MHYTYDNCNEAWPQTVKMISRAGIEEQSRIGRVLAYPDPVTFSYTRPAERVLFCPYRRINPFLHFFEPLWILAGRRDVNFMADLVARFKEYSDDGKIFNAAYGYRLRFPDDQIEEAVRRLRKNPADRQVVLQIRKPDDIFYTGRDTACNISIALSVRDERLSIHVFNRSNDIIWGGPAGGANYPQFTTLQEYLAGRIGVKLGKYHHTTNNMHAYIDTPDWERVKETVQYTGNPYPALGIEPFPLFDGSKVDEYFDDDLFNFFASDGQHRSTTPFFRNVVAPMWEAFRRYKSGEAQAYVPVAAEDWDMVLKSWLERKNRT